MYVRTNPAAPIINEITINTFHPIPNCFFVVLLDLVATFFVDLFGKKLMVSGMITPFLDSLYMAILLATLPPIDKVVGDSARRRTKISGRNWAYTHLCIV